jgi:hypothetical protein
MRGRLGASAGKGTAVAVNPNLSHGTAALHRSAASLGATRTPGHIAIERAGHAAARLNAYLNAMKRSGVLKGGRGKRSRGLEHMVATMRSKGFMTYATALIGADADP